jgi:hypothetical protein
MNNVTPVGFIVKFADEVEHELTAEQVLEAENGTGYFDGFMHTDPPAPNVDRAKFTDRHGRHGVVLYNELGNVVIFQRFVDNLTVVVSNVPQAWKNVIPDGALNNCDVERILNPYDEVNYLNSIMKNVISAYLKRQRAN